MAADQFTRLSPTAIPFRPVCALNHYFDFVLRTQRRSLSRRASGESRCICTSVSPNNVGYRILRRDHLTRKISWLC